MKDVPQKKSIWVSSDGQEFSVENILPKEKDIWIYYQKVKTGQAYSCLLESFSLRFKPAPFRT